MEAIILGNPTDITQGGNTPIDIPAYEAEKAVVVLSDGYTPYILEGGGSSDSNWFRYTSGILRPYISSDKVVIGGTSLLGNEILRVVGEANVISLQLGSSVTINAILDEDDMISNSNTAVPTQQSVKAYVDSQSGGYLQAGDNISLLVNDIPYLTEETDPIFNVSAAKNITNGDISNWNTAYSWGNWGTQGFLTTETDPIFTASAAYTITESNITDWGTAYTSSHTHSNKTLLDTLTSAGAGTQFLANDGTYKSISTTVAGSDTEIQFNDGGTSFGGDSTFTFNKTIKLVTSYDSLISNSLYLGDNTAYITNSSGDLSFTDGNAGTVTLSTLLTGVTNYWSTTTGGIYYGAGTDKVGINTSSLTEALTIDGNIAATNFNSSYLRYKNSNLLLGPNAGDNETGDNLLYISNSDTANPLVKGDFLNQSIEFNADTYINSVKRLCFGSSEVYIRRDSTTDDMLFSDPNTNSGDPVKLSDFVRDASLYALKSDFTQYSAVTSITNANKTTWNKASVLITTGGGTNYLADDGTYKAAGGGVVPTDYTFKWDSGASYYRPYTTKTEAGGVLSAGKFYSGTDTPTATNRLNYDGDFYAHYFYGYRGEFTMVVGTTLNITSTTSVGGVMNSRGYTMSSNFGGNTTFSDNLLTVSRLVSDTVSSTGNILQLTDNPTSSGTISGALISGTIGTTERLRFDPRATSTGSTVSNFIDTHAVLNTGDKILSVRNHGNEIINVNPAGLKITGKLDVSGLIDPTGLQLDAVASNPGTSTTVWVNSGDNGLYYNTDKLGKAQSTGNTYNPSNPLLFNKDYQFNDYILTANITPTYSLTGAAALSGTLINFIGDGIHTVDFSNFTESYNSQPFDITDEAVNTVLFYYNGSVVYYTIQSGLTEKINFKQSTSNPGNTNTLWVNNSNGKLYYGSEPVGIIDDVYLPSTGNVYLGSPTVDGSWRIAINGTGLEFQRRESGSWIMKGTIEA